MKQSIRIDDPNRNPRQWNALLTGPQVAVMHYDFKTGTWRKENGDYSNSPEEEKVLIFDSLQEAREDCRETVETNPSIFCRIYDSRGTAQGELEAIYAESVMKKSMGSGAARRKVAYGSLMVLASGACVLVDWRLGGPVIFGVLIGSKFLTSGIMRMVEGFSGLMDSRAK